MGGGNGVRINDFSSGVERGLRNPFPWMRHGFLLWRVNFWDGDVVPYGIIAITMTLTLDIPDQLVADVAVEATTEGLSREEWAQRLIERHFAERSEQSRSLSDLPEAARKRISRRRAALLEQQGATGLTEPEAVELAALQSLWGEYRPAVPPPWNYLDSLDAAGASDEDFDEDFLRPTMLADSRARDLLTQATALLKTTFPEGYLFADGDGGIGIEWVRGMTKLYLRVPGVETENPRLFVRLGGKEQGTVCDLTPDRLAEYLDKFNEDGGI